MYLAGNAYPEIQYTNVTVLTPPHQSHTQAVRKIAHYLKGLVFKITGDLFLDCNVNTSFAGLWN